MEQEQTRPSEGVDRTSEWASEAFAAFKARAEAENLRYVLFLLDPKTRDCWLSTDLKPDALAYAGNEIVVVAQNRAVETIASGPLPAPEVMP